MCENRIFYEKTKKDHQKFWQMKYRKFAGQIPKSREISEKRGNFFGRHVDVHYGRVGQAQVDAYGQGRGVKTPIFLWTS